jgi:hypothetical protein
MRASENLVGQRFGKLRVVGRSRKKDKWQHRFYNVVCDCGIRRIAEHSNLTSGSSRSCGCYRLDQIRKANTTHGHRRGGKPSPTYVSYWRMIDRCTNSKNPNYRYYGAVGIKVCARWLQSFEAFLIDMNVRPAGMTLGRFADTGNYQPGNCAWMDMAQQQAQQKIKKQLLQHKQLLRSNPAANAARVA